jgi:hypothetical protein
MSIINYFNTSLLLNGCAMFITNIGAKYIMSDMTLTIDYLFKKYIFLKWIVVFSIAFMATKNIKISLLLSIIFFIIFRCLLNPNNKLCMININ